MTSAELGTLMTVTHFTCYFAVIAMTFSASSGSDSAMTSISVSKISAHGSLSYTEQ